MQSALASRLAEDTDDSVSRRELWAYLESALKPFRSLSDSRVIIWWRDHSVIYPTLAKMARNYLAIPASSTVSKHQFSSDQHIGTDIHNPLSPTIFEAVQVLKG